MKKHNHSSADLVKTGNVGIKHMRCNHCGKDIVKGKKTDDKAFGIAKVFRVEGDRYKIDMAGERR